MPTSSGGSALVRTPVRLSAAQKRDLVGQAVAAVITTALIAAPLVVPRETAALGAAVRPIAAAPVTLRAVVAAPAAVADPPAAVADAPAAVLASPDASSIKHREKTVPALFVVQPERAMPAAAANTVSDGRDAPRKPLARRFAGLLTGDGSHPVRPFPTIATARQ